MRVHAKQEGMLRLEARANAKEKYAFVWFFFANLQRKTQSSGTKTRKKKLARAQTFVVMYAVSFSRSLQPLMRRLYY